MEDNCCDISFLIKQGTFLSIFFKGESERYLNLLILIIFAYTIITSVHYRNTEKNMIGGGRKLK